MVLILVRFVSKLFIFWYDKEVLVIELLKFLEVIFFFKFLDILFNCCCCCKWIDFWVKIVFLGNENLVKFLVCLIILDSVLFLVIL